LFLAWCVDVPQVELTGFLRKDNRPLRQAALDTLEAIAANYGPALPASAIPATVSEASTLIKETDLSLTALSLELLVTLLKQQPAAVGPPAAEKALPAALDLVKSSLLQGSASTELQAFFPALAAAGVASASAEQLVDMLLKEGLSSAAGRHAQHSIAQCLAVLCTAGGGKGTEALVERLLTMTSSRDVGEWRGQGGLSSVVRG
jgi:cullin-associated NEDD8-dissociated protein 1